MSFFPCPDEGTKSLHQEQKTESGTISFLQLGQFMHTSEVSAHSKKRVSSRRNRFPTALRIVVKAAP